ncbi:uncharacterized protein B0H18DRAFT_1040835, partial [Fomitopsis serialis]|uniref:uncharacterized protein n=1 Tax=Fomitopsis serialis TaxID=139415 RepID=UPI0020087F2F
MVTPYVSTITPPTAYLTDPLNAYAHLSMPKPFVHWIGPPLDVALDSRTSSNLGRLVRSRCRPNGILSSVPVPMLSVLSLDDLSPECRSHNVLSSPPPPHASTLPRILFRRVLV